MGLFFSDPQTRLNKRFFKAMGARDFAAAEAALKEGADIESLTYNQTRLYGAAAANDMERARFLLAHKANPNAVSESGFTVLMVAVENNNVELAALLIEQGSDINLRRTDNGWTALHMAAHQGKAKIVALLLEKGADKTVKDDRLYIAADWARTHHPKIADFIDAFGVTQEVAPAPQPVPAQPVVAEETAGWRLSAPDEVTYISERAQIGYRLTEIFNFGAGTYTRIAQNIKTGAESQTLRFFDEFSNRDQIDKARDALVKLGGAAPADATLKKPALSQPGGKP